MRTHHALRAAGVMIVTTNVSTGETTTATDGIPHYCIITFWSTISEIIESGY